jgi:ribonuclease Z
LNIYGLHHTLDRIEDLMGFYSWENWPNFFPVVFHRLPQEEMTAVLENDEFRIIASPVRHMVPTIGLRLENVQSRKSVAYSCDTEPCEQVVRLANRVDFLIHEATGTGVGHSSAAQAGEIASEAGVNGLYLIHYQTRGVDTQGLIAEAQSKYDGKVALAEDFMQLEF